MNPIKIDTTVLAPLLLTGTTLLNRVLIQGVEQALVSAAAEYGLKCLKLLPQCRENFTKIIVKAFKAKSAAGRPAEPTENLRDFSSSAIHDQVFAPVPDVVFDKLPAKKPQPPAA